MVKLVQKKIESATLIETLIAMVIIMVVFAIAIKVFNNVMASGVSFKKIQVQNQLHLLSKKVQNDGEVVEDHLVIDSVDYNLSADTSAVPGLSKLTIKANQQGKLLGTIRCLYKVKEVGIEN